MESTFDATVCLIFKTAYPIESISAIMEIEPTGTIRQGESRFAFIPKADKNVWTLRKRYIQQSDIGACLQDYFESIPGFKEKICEVNQYGICTLRLSIISLWGQIAFSLSSNDLQFLSQLGIPFEVSIFSYGQCVDNS